VVQHAEHTEWPSLPLLSLYKNDFDADSGFALGRQTSPTCDH
jgi:hypothetical protein